MSITCSYSLLLFLLCLSLHACNARRFGAPVLDKQLPQQKFHFSSEDNNEDYDHKTGTVDEITAQANVMKSKGDKSSTVVQTQTRKKITWEERSSSNDEKVKGSAAYHVVETKSLVSVSWRVPHKKRGEKQPGFNLDYSPPKTHPPSHN